MSAQIKHNAPNVAVQSTKPILRSTETAKRRQHMLRRSTTGQKTLSSSLHVPRPCRVR